MILKCIAEESSSCCQLLAGAWFLFLEILVFPMSSCLLLEGNTAVGWTVTTCYRLHLLAEFQLQKDCNTFVTSGLTSKNDKCVLCVFCWHLPPLRGLVVYICGFAAACKIWEEGNTKCSRCVMDIYRAYWIRMPYWYQACEMRLRVTRHRWRVCARNCAGNIKLTRLQSLYIIFTYCFSESQ